MSLQTDELRDQVFRLQKRNHDLQQHQRELETDLKKASWQAAFFKRKVNSAENRGSNASEMRSNKEHRNRIRELEELVHMLQVDNAEYKRHNLALKESNMASLLRKKDPIAIQSHHAIGLKRSPTRLGNPNSRRNANVKRRGPRSKSTAMPSSRSRSASPMKPLKHRKRRMAKRMRKSRKKRESKQHLSLDFENIRTLSDDSATESAAETQSGVRSMMSERKNQEKKTCEEQLIVAQEPCEETTVVIPPSLPTETVSQSISTMKKTSESNESRLESESRIKQHYQMMIEEMEKEFTKVVKDLKTQQSECIDLRTQLSLERVVKEKALQQSSNLESELRGSNKQIRELKSQLRQQELNHKSVESMEIYTHQLKEENSLLQRRVRCLQKTQAEAGTHFNRDVTVLRDELESNEEKLRKLENTNSELLRENVGLLAKIEVLKKDNHDLKEQSKLFQDNSGVSLEKLQRALEFVVASDSTAFLKKTSWDECNDPTLLKARLDEFQVELTDLILEGRQKQTLLETQVKINEEQKKENDQLRCEISKYQAQIEVLMSEEKNIVEKTDDWDHDQTVPFGATMLTTQALYDTSKSLRGMPNMNSDLIILRIGICEIIDSSVLENDTNPMSFATVRWSDFPQKYSQIRGGLRYNFDFEVSFELDNKTNESSQNTLMDVPLQLELFEHSTSNSIDMDWNHNQQASLDRSQGLKKGTLRCQKQCLQSKIGMTSDFSLRKLFQHSDGHAQGIVAFFSVNERSRVIANAQWFARLLRPLPKEIGTLTEEFGTVTEGGNEERAESLSLSIAEATTDQTITMDRSYTINEVNQDSLKGEQQSDNTQEICDEEMATKVGESDMNADRSDPMVTEDTQTLMVSTQEEQIREEKEEKVETVVEDNTLNEIPEMEVGPIIPDMESEEVCNQEDTPSDPAATMAQPIIDERLLAAAVPMSPQNGSNEMMVPPTDPGSPNPFDSVSPARGRTTLFMKGPMMIQSTENNLNEQKKAEPEILNEEGTLDGVAQSEDDTLGGLYDSTMFDDMDGVFGEEEDEEEHEEPTVVDNGTINHDDNQDVLPPQDEAEQTKSDFPVHNHPNDKEDMTEAMENDYLNDMDLLDDILGDEDLF